MFENFIVVHTQLRRRKSTGGDSRCFAEEKMSNSFNKYDITNIPPRDHLDKLLCHLQCFFQDQRKKDRSEFKPDTIMSSFQKTPAVGP